MRKLSILLIACLMVHPVFAQQAKLMLPMGHTGSIISAAFSANCARVLTLDGTGDAKIWDAKTGQLLADFNDQIRCVKFSPDGRSFAAGYENGTIKIWNIEQDKVSLSFRASRTYIDDISYTPDGSKITASPTDSIAKIWDAQTGKILLKVKENGYKVSIALFSPNGKQLITSAVESSVSNIWNTETGKLIATLKGHTNDIRSLVFTQDGKKIITTSYDKTIKVWDAITNKLLVDVISKSTYFASASISPDRRLLLTTRNDNTAQIWNVATSSLVATLIENDGYVDNAIFTPDGKHILTLCRSGECKIWDTQTHKLLNDWVLHGEGMGDISISPDGQSLLSTSNQKDVKIWNLTDRKLQATLSGHVTDAVTGKFISNTLIATTSKDQTAKIWNVFTGKPIISLKGIQFSADGKKTASDSAFKGFGVRGAPKIWNAQNSQLFSSLQGSLSDVSTNLIFQSNNNFSADGKKFFTISRDSTLRVWDTETGTLLSSIKALSSFVYAICFSPDGKKIALSYRDSTAKVWDVSTGKLLIRWVGHSTQVTDIGFSPDGKKLVVTNDYQVYVLDAESGKTTTEIKSVNGINFTPYKAIFSPDGKKILTTEISFSTFSIGTYKLWDAQTGVLITNFNKYNQGTNDAQLSSDGKRIMITYADGAVKIFDTQNGSLLTILDVKDGTINSAYFSPDDKLILSLATDGSYSIWNSLTGKYYYTFFPVNADDYLIVDKDYRYDGTPLARKLLYFTCGTEVINLDQVKDQLWVPNLAERIMNGDSINAKKLSDIDICGLTPEVEKRGKVGYHYHITPRRGGIGEVALLVNDIEIKRYKPGQLIKTSSGYELNLTEEQLSSYFVSGKVNSVMVKAYTATNDIASRGVQIAADETNKKSSKPNLYAVMIGISDYKGPELQLKYAAKDAVDISATIAVSATKLLGKEHVFMYNLTTGQNHYLIPEKIAIKNVFSDIGKKTNANDILLVFFAGHGITSGAKKQFYFLTADASTKTAAEAPAEVGISTQELSEWMKPANIRAQKRILIMDACNSGQAINELVKIGNDAQHYLAARSDDKTEQVKAIDKLNERSGLFILAASASNQSAYEMGRYSQGLLTYSLLKAIKQQPEILEDGKYLNVSRWFDAAEKTVSDMVRETGNRQEPQIVSAGNFNIGQVDDDVVKIINLADEMPLFTPGNFQNSDESIADDNLELSKYINNYMYEISARSANNTITYVTASTSAEAWSLSGRYDVKDDDIVVKVNVKQNRYIKYRLEVTGKKNDLQTLSEQIIKQATDLILKKK